MSRRAAGGAVLSSVTGLASVMDGTYGSDSTAGSGHGADNLRPVRVRYQMIAVTGKPSSDSNADTLVFELIAGIDITKLPLTAEEGFVLSRMMSRRVSIPDLTR